MNRAEIFKAAAELLRYSPKASLEADWIDYFRLKQDAESYEQMAAAFDRLAAAAVLDHTEKTPVDEIIRLYEGKDGLLEVLDRIVESEDDPRAGEAAYTLAGFYLGKERPQGLECPVSALKAKIYLSHALRKGYEPARDEYVARMEKDHEFLPAMKWVKADGPLGIFRRRMYEALYEQAKRLHIAPSGKLDEEYLIRYPAENGNSVRINELRKKLAAETRETVRANEELAARAQDSIRGDAAGALEKLKKTNERVGRFYLRFRKGLFYGAIGIVVFTLVNIILSFVPGVVGEWSDTVTQTCGYPFVLLEAAAKKIAPMPFADWLKVPVVWGLSDIIGSILGEIIFLLIMFKPIRMILSIGPKRRCNRKFFRLKKKLVRRLGLDKAAEFDGSLTEQQLSAAFREELKGLGIQPSAQPVNFMARLYSSARFASPKAGLDVLVRDELYLGNCKESMCIYTMPFWLRQDFGCMTDDDCLRKALQIIGEESRPYRMELAWEMLLAGLSARIIKSNRELFGSEHPILLSGRAAIEDAAHYINKWVGNHRDSEPFRSAMILAQGILTSLADAEYKKRAENGDKHAAFMMTRCTLGSADAEKWFDKAYKLKSVELFEFAARYGNVFGVTSYAMEECFHLAWSEKIPGMWEPYQEWERKHADERRSRARQFEAQQAAQKQAMNAFRGSLDAKEREFNLLMNGSFDTNREMFAGGELPHDLFNMLDSMRDSLEDEFEKKLKEAAYGPKKRDDEDDD